MSKRPGPSGESLVAGKRAAIEAVRAGRAREVLVSDTAKQTAGLRELVAAAERTRTPLRPVPRERLDELARDNQGVVAFVDPAKEPGERDLETWPWAGDALVVVLDGITDPQNLGAAARAADAGGADMLVTRTRRAAGVTPAAVRASAGALVSLPHARVANIARALERLKGAGFTVVGLDQAATRTVYDGRCPPGRLALVIGSEDKGLSRLASEACDMLVSLPMQGRVASMNAAGSLAAALFAYVVPHRR